MTGEVPQSSSLTIALDAMGGDTAPKTVLEGAAQALDRYPDIRFLLFGREEDIHHCLVELPAVARASKVIHTDDVIGSDVRPSVALRQGKNSSMRLAIEAVKQGKASCVVSGGNTGALMAIAKLVLRTLPGIDRPAIASLLPSIRGDLVMLDLGANVECSPKNLYQFAMMGDAFTRSISDNKQPVIGLLNIGSEDIKGHENLKEAAQLLRESEVELNFYGFVEGTDIGEGVVDVVVTDGFSGNVAIKTAEGTAKMFAEFLKHSLRSSWLGRLGYLIARPALKGFRKRLDPREYNGGVLLGLNGIVVKSHGGSDAYGFANAVSMAVELAKHRINQKIMTELAIAGETSANGKTPATREKVRN